MSRAWTLEPGSLGLYLSFSTYLLQLSVPQFPLQENGHKNSTKITVLLGRFKV